MFIALIEHDGGRHWCGRGFAYLMKGMIEFRADLIFVIFAIMATGFVT